MDRNKVALGQIALKIWWGPTKCSDQEPYTAKLLFHQSLCCTVTTGWLDNDSVVSKLTAAWWLHCHLQFSHHAAGSKQRWLHCHCLVTVQSLCHRIWVLLCTCPWKCSFSHSSKPNCLVLKNELFLHSITKSINLMNLYKNINTFKTSSVPLLSVFFGSK